MLGTRNYILPTFQNITLILKKNKLLFWWFQTEKEDINCRGITSTHHGDSDCVNCLHSFTTESKLELHKKCENKDFHNVVMPSVDTKILKFNQYYRSDKASFIIYADLECLIDKIDGYKNNPENSSTE